jgi:hypothetical protein
MSSACSTACTILKRLHRVLNLLHHHNRSTAERTALSLYLRTASQEVSTHLSYTCVNLSQLKYCDQLYTVCYAMPCHSECIIHYAHMHGQSLQTYMQLSSLPHSKQQALMIYVITPISCLWHVTIELTGYCSGSTPVHTA